MPTPAMPYFDDILAKISAEPESDIVRAFGTRHVHWGYYEPPTNTDTSTAGLMDAAETLTTRLCDLVEVCNDQRILDAGCGFGGTIASLNERLHNVDLTGLNIDGRQLVRARTTVQSHKDNQIRFIEGDACQMPFPDRSFDIVLAVECIFHFPSRWRFFREARRVLKPGGRLALSDFVPLGPSLPLLGLYALLKGRSVGNYYGDFNLAFCTSAMYYWLARVTGFRVDKNLDVTGNTLPTYPALLRMIRESPNTQAEAATQQIEWVSRKKLLRYRFLSFTAI